MPPGAPVCHVVSPWRLGLYADLHARLGARARVRHWERLPDGRQVAPNDLILVDLTEPSEAADLKLARSLARQADLLLVIGETPVAPGWLEVARHLHVSSVRLGAQATSGGCAPAVAWVLQKVRGYSARDISQLVLEREPALLPLSDLVEALCQQPWQVRCPAHLAALVGTSRRGLWARCSALGFGRVEHFLCLVRAVAFEQLRRRQVSSWQALVLAGIGNASDFRKQLRHLERGSPQAWARFRMGGLTVACWLVPALLALFGCGRAAERGDRLAEAAPCAVANGVGAAADAFSGRAGTSPAPRTAAASPARRVSG